MTDPEVLKYVLEDLHNAQRALDRTDCGTAAGHIDEAQDLVVNLLVSEAHTDDE